MATTTSIHEKFNFTSGYTDPVWIKTEKLSNRPKFTSLTEDIKADVCIVGAGIAGISTAYELVKRGKEVVLLEAREILSGETARTTGHLSSALDDLYNEIAKKHGKEGARHAADSHNWALNHIGDVSKELGIECEYRHVPGYRISQFYDLESNDYKKDVKTLLADMDAARESGLQVDRKAQFQMKGWNGKQYNGLATVYKEQATFHPTKYVTGVLRWLKDQPNFRCFTNTRVMNFNEESTGILGMGSKHVQVETESGKSIVCEYAVEATCVPLQKLSVIIQMEYNRTYAIAIRIPKGSVEDCVLYDSNDPYMYLRLTECDEKDDYLVVGGCDHPVGQEGEDGRFEELEKWTRERFTHAGAVDYKWSGQIFDPVDYMAYIGKNQGNDNIFIITGDSGNGLTHGIIASKLIADQVEGKPNAWSDLYSPKRLGSMLKSAPSMIAHDVQVNMQYKRFLQSDITDIEDLVPGSGGVLNPKTSKPLAVYKDEDGNVTKMSALCPHLKGVVCWNHAEKSFDCPIHGSRFSADGVCVQGPAKANLTRED
ncbi:FAD dependent oxidoreductase [Seiridium cupressi]